MMGETSDRGDLNTLRTREVVRSSDRVSRRSPDTDKHAATKCLDVISLAV